MHDCHWRNIIKHLFNVNTTSYNEKLFTMCRFQVGCSYIVYVPSMSPAGSFSPVVSFLVRNGSVVLGIQGTVRLHSP